MRSFSYWDGTWISDVPALTRNCCPVRAFCGLPPSAGGLKRGSAHAPVHVGGSAGSTTASKCVSLYVVSTRLALPAGSACQRVFQNISLPLKKARFTPLAAADLTA